MKRYITIIIAGLFSLTSFAHSPDTSTTVLVEKENNVWVLQISASLTAFQQEIRTHFSETPYTTPEEFKEMVVAHIKNNIEILFDDNKAISLKNGKVKLGHETNVVFEVEGIPLNMNTITITNKSFKDIYKSKSALIILKENFSKNKFILNEANDHGLSLAVVDNEFVEVVPQKASFFSPTILLLLVGVLGIGFAFNYKSKKPELE